MAKSKRIAGQPTKAAVAYIRVSKERDDMISPDLQLRAITSFAEREGYHLVEVIEDLDLTGTEFDNRSVGRVVEGIREGRWDAVLLWKWSRWGRNLELSLTYLRQVEEAGGEVRAATEDIDASTAVGHLSRNLSLLLAEFESKQKSETWREVQSRRLANGRPHGGAPRFGYAKDGQDFVPDPVTGPALAEAYERWVAGASLRSVLLDLNARGLRSSRGGLIKANSLLATMDSGFAAGWLRGRSHTGKDRYRHEFDCWTEGRHEPLISQELWEGYKAKRAASKKLPTRLRQARYSLSGLVYCTCGSRMVAAKTAQVTTWRCAAQQDTSSCPVRGTSARVTVVEALVWEWIQTHAKGESFAEIEMRRRAAAGRSQSRLEQYEAEIRRLTQKRKRLADGFTDGDIGRDDYRSQRDDIAAALVVAEEGRLAAQGERRVSSVQTQRMFKGLEATWSAMSEHDRREALTQVIAKVVVRKGHHTRPDKYEIVPRWA